MGWGRAWRRVVIPAGVLIALVLAGWALASLAWGGVVLSDLLELRLWLFRLGGGMLVTGTLVALATLAVYRRLRSRTMRILTLALAVMRGVPLVVGIPLLLWNLR